MVLEHEVFTTSLQTVRNLMLVASRAKTDGNPEAALTIRESKIRKT